MNITLYTDETLFADLSDEWNGLLNDSLADKVFLTRDWQQTWWEAYHPGRIWALAIRDEESGRLEGLAPWFLAIDPDGTRILREIGCVDVTDYLELIARRGIEDAVFETIADFLAAHKNEFDEIRLCNVPAASLTLSSFPTALESREFRSHIQLQEVCPVVDLPEKWQDYVASLDKKNRHELRRKIRRATGHVAWYIVGPEHDLDEELERFLRLMAASAPEKASFLEDPENERFFHLMVPRMAQHGWLQLAFLTVNGDAAAAYLNFDYGNRILVYNSGHDAGEYGNLSPGIVLLARLIELAIDQRREAFDFLRGDEAYKYDLGGLNTHVYQLIITAADRAE